jgi:hypothetical protein
MPALGLDLRVTAGTPEDIVRAKRSYTGQTRLDRVDNRLDGVENRLGRVESKRPVSATNWMA